MGRNILGLPLDKDQPWPHEATWIPIYVAVWYGAATVMVAQRLLVRILKLGSLLGLDDALIAGGWLAATACFIEIMLVTTSRGSSPVEPSEFEFIALMLWLIEMAFLISQCFIKLSVLAILNRFVKETAETRIRYAIYGAASLTTGYSLAIFLALFILCSPVKAYWRAFDADFAMHHDFRCFNQTVSNLLAGVIAVISDLYTIAIPWAISRSFGLTKKQALALNIVFTFGLVVTAASCMRTYYLYYVFRGEDISRSILYAVIWATVEIQLAIICACMPSLRVLYRLIVRPRISSVAHHRYYSRHGSPDMHDLEDRLPSSEGTPMEEIPSDATYSHAVRDHGKDLSTPDRSGSSLL